MYIYIYIVTCISLFSAKNILKFRKLQNLLVIQGPESLQYIY